MIDKLLTTKYSRWAVAAVLLTFAAFVLAEDRKSDDIASRQYWVDITLYSCQPDDVLSTYRKQSEGGVGPYGTLGLVVEDSNRHFNVSIQPKLKSKRFLVPVKITPDKQDTQTRAQEIEYDLTDIVPRSVELAHDDNGRVYRLNLAPRLIEQPKLKQFESRDLRLEYWSFPSSPVIMNDQEYMGQLSMSGGSLAWCDIPGLAKIEFSLLHLKNAQPLGTLQDGVINIKHENGTTLRITNVKNGIHEEMLRGGPYHVWVHWNKPTQSVEEYRQTLKEYIAKLKERVKNGDASVSPEGVKRLEKMCESDHIGLTSNGARSASPDELEHPDE